MPGNYLQTLGRGLDALEALRSGPQTVSDIARRLDLERSAAYRIMRTLEAHRFVTRDDGGVYRLGLAVWELGVRIADVNDVRVAAAREMAGLVDTFGETAHLSVYDRGEVVYVDLREGTHPIRSYTRLGGRAPAYCVATGKALLAHQSADEIDRVIADGLEAHTEATLTSPAALRAQLRDIQAGGAAVNHGEWRDDVGGLAVPIVDPNGGVVSAIGLSGPVQRILARRDDIVPALQAAARRIRG